MNNLNYFDNAATTEPCAEAIVEYVRTIDDFGNASAIYDFGRSNKKMIEQARKTIAELINAEPDEIFFTSGGTESDNWALKGFIGSRNILITSKIEHPAILETGKWLHDRAGWMIGLVNAKKDGEIDMKQFGKFLTDCSWPDRAIVSVMLANNETGVIQPIKNISEQIRRHDKTNILLHTDAVQALGHIPINVKDLGVDMLSGSAHKFHGLKGCGFLYIRKKVQDEIQPWLTGGHQENGLRASTYNTGAILAMAEALKVCCNSMESDANRMKMMKKDILNLLGMGCNDVNGNFDNTLPNIMNIQFPTDIRSEELLAMLNMADTQVSAGSACASDLKHRSHVLTAMGVPPDKIDSSIRISLSRYTTMLEVNNFCRNIKDCISLLKARDRR